MQTMFHMSYIEMGVLPSGHMPHQILVKRRSLVIYMAFEMSWFWTVKFPLKNEATYHIEFILPYLRWVWMKLRQIIHGVRYRYHQILISQILETIRVLLYSFSLGFAPQFWYKRLVWEFELRGVGDCGLVIGYFIFIECYISHIRSLR